MKTVTSIVLNNFTHDSRVLKENLSLKKAGFDVKVIALHQKGLPEYENVQGIPVHRIKLISKEWSKNPLIQMIKYLELTYKICKKYINTSIIHCNDLAPLPIAVLIKLITWGRVKVVYDAHEFETEQSSNGSFLRKKYLLVGIEKYLIKRTDAFITVSNGIAEEYKKRYGIKKPAVIMNCPQISAGQKSDVLRSELKIAADKIVFLYLGGLYPGRGIDLMLDAFKTLNNQRCVLVLIGYGDMEDLVIDTAKNHSNIYFHPAVNSDEVIRYASSADIGICLIENTCLSNFYSLPNKLFEYAMSGLPILASNLPEFNIIKKYDCGVIVNDETVASVIDGINEILSKDLKTLSENVSLLAKEYNWESQEKKLIEIYKGLS